MLDKKTANWISLLVTVIIAVGIGAFAGSKLLNNDIKSTNRVAAGKQIYDQHCASCHGKNLEGQTDWKTRNAQGRLPAPPHDETGHTWHHADQLLFDLTKYGMVPPNIPEGYESDMPAFENVLSDEDIWAVLHFIKSRWPEKIQASQREMSARGSSFQKP